MKHNRRHFHHIRAEERARLAKLLRFLREYEEKGGLKPDFDEIARIVIDDDVEDTILRLEGALTDLFEFREKYPASAAFSKFAERFAPLPTPLSERLTAQAKAMGWSHGPIDDYRGAVAAAQAGADAALSHAERVHDGWNAQATAHLREYARHNSEFMTESVRVWATDQGLPVPPSARAWGNIMTAAARAGIIFKSGVALTKVPPAHATYAAVWTSKILVRAT